MRTSGQTKCMYTACLNVFNVLQDTTPQGKLFQT